MANKQIYELNNAGNDLDNSALLAMDIPNPDSSAASEIPYVTRKASINVLENQFLGEDEYTTELNTENQTIFGSINEVLTYAKNIAEEYDDAATYAIGDFVTYEGVLYKCIVAITVAEAWNSAHWDSTLIVDEFGGSGGASVTLGTTVPSDASGSNGDLYVQYDGTSYAAVFAYVKINDSWRKYPYAKVVALTRAQYDLITPDNDTLYIITDEQGSYVKLPIITDAWNSSTSYTVGMYCIHNDTLWKCTTANSNQEPVSGSTYWDDTSVADELALKQDNLSKPILTNTDLDTLRLENGYYYISGLTSAHHAPCSYGVLEVVSTSICLQRITQASSTGVTATVYERIYINGAWTAWETVEGRPIWLYSTETVSLTANTVTVISFTFSVPTGYSIVTAFDDSYYANVIPSVIRINAGSGSKVVHMSYYSTTAQSHTWTCRALALPNVDVRT